MSAALLIISPKSKMGGYVYIAKINRYCEDTEGCYKIGSTVNINSRMRHLSTRYGATVTLIAYGYSYTRLKSERFLQTLLIKNRWVGGLWWWSNEYFLFDEKQILLAIDMLNLISVSIDVCRVDE